MLISLSGITESYYKETKGPLWWCYSDVPNKGRVRCQDEVSFTRSSALPLGHQCRIPNHPHNNYISFKTPDSLLNIASRVFQWSPSILLSKNVLKRHITSQDPTTRHLYGFYYLVIVGPTLQGPLESLSFAPFAELKDLFSLSLKSGTF